MISSRGVTLALTYSPHVPPVLGSYARLQFTSGSRAKTLLLLQTDAALSSADVPFLRQEEFKQGPINKRALIKMIPSIVRCILIREVKLNSTCAFFFHVFV